jgi:hypothetical protein
VELIYSEGPEDFDPEDPHCIAQEYAMEIDREYFRTHPGETSYHLRLVKPLLLSMGIEEAFLLG